MVHRSRSGVASKRWVDLPLAERLETVLGLGGYCCVEPCVSVVESVMSKRWCYTLPGGAYHSDVEMCFTESEILAMYFDYWSEQMRRVDKETEISPEACIEDWVVINWAEPRE